MVFCPIGGKPVPFHVSTIKSISKPDPDKASYLRINFYTPGAAMPKEAPKNMAQLVLKHSEKMPFIKDLTFRSLDPRNIEQVFRIYQEMRKRIRQREQKAEQEKDLVVQAKLQKIKDQRAPQLQDLTMRPQLTGRKSSVVWQLIRMGCDSCRARVKCSTYCMITSSMPSFSHVRTL